MSDTNVQFIPQFLDAIKTLANEKGQFFFPQAVADQRNPQYEPYTDSSVWNLGTMSSGGTTLQNTMDAVCTGGMPVVPPFDDFDCFGLSFNATPGQFPSIVLGQKGAQKSQVVLRGLSNIFVTDMDVSDPAVGSQFTAAANVGHWPAGTVTDMPSQLTIVADYTMNQQCSASSPCKGQGSGGLQITGQITVTFPTTLVVTANATISTTSTPDPNAFITGTPMTIAAQATHLQFVIADSELANIVIVATVEEPFANKPGVSEQTRKTFEDNINFIFAQTYAKQQLLVQLNQFLCSPATLGDFSKLISEKLNDLLTNTIFGS